MNAVQRTLAIVAATVLAAAGCGRPADPGLVKIVSSLPRTGSAKQQSDTIVRGIRMAIEEAEGRAGSTLDLTADVVGHDLSRGTASFERGRRVVDLPTAA